jgi:chaperonin GroES
LAVNGTPETLLYWLLDQIEIVGTRRGTQWIVGTLSRRVLRTALAVRGPASSAGGSAKIGKLHMTFRPLHDRVLVRRIEAQEKTAGGIIIPDTAQEKPQEGEVVSVGMGARGEDGKVTPLELKTGDKILFGKWSGSEVKLDGEDLIIMKESDVLGVMA